MIIGQSSKTRFKIFFFILAAACIAGLFSAFYSRGIPWIHDEASYLFQAKTFLQGRLANPVHPEHLFFDQYQVINEGLYASKYFPGYAVTLMPFVRMGLPYLNPIVFYALELGLIYLVGREMFGEKTAAFGTVLAAFSPQIFLQTAFLLNHIAGAVFSLIFFLGFLKWRKNGSALWALAGSAAWAFSFLIRPLTAVGFAVPVAIIAIVGAGPAIGAPAGQWRLVPALRSGRPQGAPLRLTLKSFCAWALPVLLGLFLYLGYNKAVTGQWLKTPFDLYAEIHAPFHRYGFYTWDKFAHQATGPRVDKILNELYHNHTPADGLILAGLRLEVFSTSLTGSEILGTLLLGLWIWRLRRLEFHHLLIFSGWLSIQAIHFPHWFPGIFITGSNYFYEVSGLVILAIADTLMEISKTPMLRAKSEDWVKGFAAVWILFSIMTIQPAGEQFYKKKLPMLWLHKTLAKEKINKAAVFVRYGQNFDIAQDLIYNDPGLNGPLILARDFGEKNSRLKSYFPGYTFLLWNYEHQKLTQQ